MHIHDPKRLVESLCALPQETGWVEFKENKFNEDSVGQYVSSLANSAMFDGKDAAYLIFGVRDDDHTIVGTRVDLLGEKVGSESFLLWLNKYLDPHITINTESVDIDGKNVQILCIDPGYRQPVKFKKIPYIRVSSSQQPLSNYPERERALWQITSRYSFETSTLKDHLTFSEIEKAFALDVLLNRIGKKTLSRKMKVDYLTISGLIKSDLQGKFEVSSLLAIASAREFREFPSLENKGSRVIAYKGTNKLNALADKESHKGHLVTFVGFLEHVMNHIPSVEEMQHGVRKKIYAIPEISIREFLANALVHQDFTDATSKPVVEVFKDRVRISNPGLPLVSVDRFIDTPSKSRNPRFARLMREAGFCEERGSGVDRAITEIEKAALPPPLIEEVEGSTVVTVFMPRRFANMSQEERIRACFQHACLRHEQGDPMSNTTLRERFGLSQKQYPQVSIVIRDALAAGRIKPLSEDQGNRNARYVPFYAAVS
ncbi:putative DNA binding domain-containing protein [Sphingomonas sp. QA11]|uniref:ATP-binding protein n=1 Tax=Sphingomonas sp. QA11 TaxID=2950605 RepID=UPI00234B0A9D|nr:ATP-binding protein [Sphingomonas sp. QA11]WCM25242.1 putative DNA binding domain-containing protein [Sphingomonas sp. QA11]